jgi:dolichol-phosphate mannosyltransferase
VLHRSSKRGIASAYIDGFRWALERSYDVICQMDADLSHNPVVLPGMLEKIVDHDLVIGSRYVGGGGIQNWGLLRRGLSLCANLYSRMVLQCPIHDLTSGFVLWRRAALEVLDLEAIRSKGYVFQIELKLRAHRRRFTFSEIPIVFEERKLGRSKLNLAIIWEAFVRVLRLRSLL